MEEDIKKIEEIINWLKDSSYPYDISLTRDDIQSLENLIKGYRELEKENAMLKKANNISQDVKVEDVTQVMDKVCKDFMKEFIPKSKIKEKIEELEKYRNLAREMIEHRVVVSDSDSLNYGRAEAHDKDIEVLQELMGDK